MADIVMSDILWVLLLGLLGGLVHDVVNNNGFTKWNIDKSVPAVLKLGSIGSMILGIAADLVTYASTVGSAAAGTSVPFTQLIVIAFTSGIGGGAILNAYVSKQTANVNQATTKVKMATAKLAAHHFCTSKDAEAASKFIAALESV